jgi:hypothetical protein
VVKVANVTKFSLGKKIRLKIFTHSMHGRKGRKFCPAKNFRLYGIYYPQNKISHTLLLEEDTELLSEV